MIFFEKFCRQLLNRRRESKDGRTSDFINIMLKSQILEGEKSTATRSRLKMLALFIEAFNALNFNN